MKPGHAFFNGKHAIGWRVGAVIPSNQAFRDMLKPASPITVCRLQGCEFPVSGCCKQSNFRRHANRPAVFDLVAVFAVPLVLASAKQIIGDGCKE